MRSVSTFTRSEIEKLNELRRMLKRGVLPAYLINPQILKEHNETNPKVSQIHETSEVNLSALLHLVAGAPSAAIEARLSTKRMLSMAPRDIAPEPQEAPLAEDAKIDRLCDEKENE